MKTTTVLVVDDSLTMRAFLSGALESVKGIQVVGTAGGADEARTLIRDLDPDVVTLDIEMPGLSGTDFLSEIMASAPRPVVMLSAFTERGAAASVDALRLGAIDCFPKPRIASSAELPVIIDRLARILKGATARLAARSGGTASFTPVPLPAPPVACPPFAWNGRIVAIGADASHTARLFDLLARLPADGPPVLVHQQVHPDLLDGIAGQLAGLVRPRVLRCADGQAILPGHVYLVPTDGPQLAVDRWPGGTIVLRPDPARPDRQPSVAGLFAALTAANARQSLGILLGAEGNAASAAAAVLRARGGLTITPLADAGYELASAYASQPVAAAALAAGLLDRCRTG